MDTKAMYKVSYGLYVITANQDGRDNGCITNTFTQVADSPNLVSFSINKKNLTHDMILKTGKYTISVLDTSAGFDIFKHFGFQSGRDADKFADFKDIKRLENGTLAVTKGTNAYISGKVVRTENVGSHTLFLADIGEMEVLGSNPSVTYEYYQQNIKPKPVDTGKKQDGQTVWRCTVCGYEYVGEELPEDFICPWCKHPASDFEKVVK